MIFLNRAFGPDVGASAVREAVTRSARPKAVLLKLQVQFGVNRFFAACPETGRTSLHLAARTGREDFKLSRQINRGAGVPPLLGKAVVLEFPHCSPF